MTCGGYAIGVAGPSRAAEPPRPTYGSPPEPVARMKCRHVRYAHGKCRSLENSGRVLTEPANARLEGDLQRRPQASGADQVPLVGDLPGPGELRIASLAVPCGVAEQRRCKFSRTMA